MNNKEGNDSLTISGLSKMIHADRPQLTRAIRDLNPPIELIAGKRINIADVPRVEAALREMRALYKKS